MKKILKTVIVCTLVLFLLSISDVFAVDTTKLADKEFKFTGVAKRYDGDTYDGSGQITQGTLIFGSLDDVYILFTISLQICCLVMPKVCLNIIALLNLAPIRPGWTGSRVTYAQWNVTLQD